MRIGLIAHSNAPWTAHYVRAFHARGHEVLLISFHPDEVPGVRRVFVGMPGDPFLRVKRVYVTRVLRVRALLKTFSADLVFAPYLISNGLTAVLSFKGPVVVSARGGDLMEHVGRLPAPSWLHRLLVQFICGRARLVHTVSEELTDALVALGVERQRVVSFPVGVDLGLFIPAEVPGAVSAVPRLICTRRHDRVYHNDVVVEALAKLSEEDRRFAMTFVGGGPLFDERRCHVRELALESSIRFTGQIAHAQLPELLRTMDIYVSASSSDGASSSLLEALACGLFPVVSNIRANRDWIRDGETGLLFEPGNAHDLAAKLARALDHRGLWLAARAENQRLVKDRADLAHNMQLLLDLLESVAGVPARHLGGGPV